MQEKLKKKKSTKKFRERERELFFVREDYAQNRRDSDKFIVRGCE